MDIVYVSEGAKKKIILQTYYNLNGDYIIFPDNPLHGKTYENVGVAIFDKISKINGIKFREQVISIIDPKEESISCELVNYIEDGDNLIIKLCQDWG